MPCFTFSSVVQWAGLASLLDQFWPYVWHPEIIIESSQRFESFFMFLSFFLFFLQCSSATHLLSGCCSTWGCIIVVVKQIINLQPFAKTQEVDLIIKCVIALIVDKMYLTTIISRHGTGDDDNKTSSAERPHCGETVQVWACSFFMLWQNEDDTEVTVTPRCHSGAIFSQCFLSADMRICLSLNMKRLTCILQCRTKQCSLHKNVELPLHDCPEHF